MGLFGDKQASLVQFHRVVNVVCLDTPANAAQRIIAATGAQSSAPLLGSKVYVKHQTDSSIALGFGNKVSDFWAVQVDLSPSPDGRTSVSATCVRCEKRMEIANFLHKTLKPVLDGVASEGR